MDLARGKRRKKTAAIQTQATSASIQSSLPDPNGAADKQLPHMPPNKLFEEQHSNLLEDLLNIDAPLQAASAAQPGESMLEALPNEILAMVSGALAPGRLSLGHTMLFMMWYREYTDSLRSLCLVSKTMEAIARPALYRDVRLYNHMAVVHLCATFCADPTLASSVRSITFCPRCERRTGDTHTIDLRPLRPFQDPDYTFWIRGKSKAKVRMPQKTREELVCTLFSKVLSRIPALQSLYLAMPELPSINPKCLKHLPGGAQLTQQLSLQESLMRDFCQGRSLPDLSKLSTVGILGREPSYDVQGLCDRLLRSPSLHKVLFFQGHCYGLTTGPQHSITEMSTSVKRVMLHHQCSITQDVVTLTKGFPSLESLAIDDGPCWPNDPDPFHGHHVFQLLGGLKNFHTLEMDTSRAGFATAITTETGPSTLVTLAALSNLCTLLVRVDFFVGFTLGSEPQLCRETTVLPHSLRRLTLLLNLRCQQSLARKGHIPRGRVNRVVEPVLREVASALLAECPHLEKVDLCYHMDCYRQHKVQTLAERSTADGGAIS